MTASDLGTNPLLPFVLMFVVLAVVLAFVAQSSERRAVRAEKRTIELYERLVAMKTTDAATTIEAALRIATTGSPEPPSARVQSAEPTGDELVRSRVFEQTVTTGMNRLAELYRAQGMTVPPDDVLREEAEMMIAGILPESMTAGTVRS